MGKKINEKTNKKKQEKRTSCQLISAYSCDY